MSEVSESFIQVEWQGFDRDGYRITETQDFDGVTSQNIQRAMLFAEDKDQSSVYEVKRKLLWCSSVEKKKRKLAELVQAEAMAAGLRSECKKLGYIKEEAD